MPGRVPSPAQLTCGLAALGLLLWTPTTAAQEGGGSGGSPLRIDSSFPSVAAPPGPSASLHLHIKGAFPQPGYELLSHLRAWARHPQHSCRLGWSEELIRELVSGSGQLWLSTMDLMDQEENRSNRSCGAIVGFWPDRVEISVNDPRLLTAGELRVGVALYPDVARGGDGRLEQRGRPLEAWVDVPIREPLGIAGHTPHSPLATAGESIRFTFAFTGAPPSWAFLDTDEGHVALQLSVVGSRVEVLIPGEAVAPPALLFLRLGSDHGESAVTLPVCTATAEAGVLCPAPPSDERPPRDPPTD